jgi:ABC-2 type transport system ATP-binding protein
MEVDAAVLCDHVSKRFLLYERSPNSLRELFIRAVLRKPISATRPYFALTDFDLRVMPGESVAIIGQNGSGKSTALRVIAGIYPPTSGRVSIRGRIAVVIELGAGFHPELTGAENIQLYGVIMGMSRREVARRYQAIVDFADIGNFVQLPVKYYSSGMRARLAFAVAVCVEHQILLLDEVLAVGDEAFRQKCLDHLVDYRKRGGTLIIASHDLDQVRKLCTRAVWLDKGQLVMSGDVDKVAGAYHAASH